MKVFRKTKKRDYYFKSVDTSTFLVELFIIDFEMLCSGMRRHYFRKALPNVCI